MKQTYVVNKAAHWRSAGGPGRILRGASDLLLLPVFLVGLWEILGHVVGSFWLSRPSLVVVQLADWITTGFIFVHLGATVGEMLLGMVLGGICGVALGLLFGMSPTVGEIISPYILAAYSLPKIALAPLLVLALGVGLQAQLTLVAFAVFFLVFLNTYAGVRDVDSDILQALRVMGASRLETVTHVILPSLTPWILTGLRISVRYAFTTAVLGEMIAGNRGLGFVAQRSAALFDSTAVFAAVIILMLFGLTITLMITRVEASLLQWKI